MNCHQLPGYSVAIGKLPGESLCSDHVQFHIPVDQGKGEQPPHSHCWLSQH